MVYGLWGYLLTGLGEEPVHQQPHLLGDLQRFLLVPSALHQQEVHLGLLLLGHDTTTLR